MLVVVIQNEFINKTISLVNEKKLLENWLNLAPEKFIKICWVNCLKPRIGLSDVACIIINWVRICYSCLKRIFQ